MNYGGRFERVLRLASVLKENRGKLGSMAVKNLKFTVWDGRKEVDITYESLHIYEQARSFLELRVPLKGEGSIVYLVLSYNGSV